MADDAKKVMARTLGDVLEGMAFTFIDSPEDADLRTDAAEFLHATIEFDGPSAGQLGIAAPKALCAELAAGVLGLDSDEGDARESMSDTLGELLNVTCGNFTTAMFGAEDLVDQSIPQVEKLDRPAWERLRHRPQTMTFMVDDVPLIAHVAVKEKH